MSRWDEPGSARELLGPALLAMIATVRATAERVAATEARRTGPADVADAPDEEAVHDFRVALRRLRTVLRPARRVYGKKKIRALEDELGAFADETGDLRDEEVLHETLSALAVPVRARAPLAAWMERRARLERWLRRALVRRVALLAVSAEPAAPALSATLARLEERIASARPRKASARRVAEASIGEALEGVRALSRGDARDAREMHALRIRCKRLRYTAELFEPVLGEHAEELARTAARLQKRLGELHDVDEATVRIDRARGLPIGVRLSVRGALGRARAGVRERAVAELAEARRALFGRRGGG